MPQPGQTFLTQSLTNLRENETTEIVAVRTVERGGEDQQLLALDDAPSKLEDAILPGSRREPVDVVPTQDVRDELQPGRINRNRSSDARRADGSRDAEITTDQLQWASNPDEYDYPGVDTGPIFRDNFDEDDFMDF